MPSGETSRTASSRGRRFAAGIALLIAAGPLVSLAGADLLAKRVRAETAGLGARLAPRIAAERSAEQARAQMRATIGRPMLAATLDVVARALPADATVLRAERTRDGALELEIAGPDPDQLRPALRALPGIGSFRNIGQRRGEAAMIVSFRAEDR